MNIEEVMVLELSDLVDYDKATGNIVVSKDIFDDFVEDSYINIQFVEDDSETIYMYRMVSENEDEVYMELMD